MRILQVINSVHPSEGGTAECVAQVSRELARIGNQVEVAAYGDSPGAQWLEDFPVKVHGLGPGYGRYSYSPKALPWLRTNLGRFDVMIMNGLWQYPSLSAFLAVGKRGMPYFVYAHGMLDPWSRSAHPFRYAKKFAYWAVFARVLLRRASGVLFACAQEAERARTFFPTSSWNGIVVGNGIALPPRATNDAIVRFHERFPQLRGKRVILFLGRIHEQKGLDVLLRAFGSVRALDPSLHLVIGGTGEAGYEHRLKELAAALSLTDYVTWTGLLQNEPKWAAFSVAELFVLASRQESFGIAVVEALATGTPVLVSDKVNISDAIVRGGAGLQCRDEPEDLARTLGDWLSRNCESREAMRRNATSCYRDHFSVDRAALALENALSSAVG